MDLDFWDCFGRKKKTLSYKQRNMVQLEVADYKPTFLPLPGFRLS